MAKNYSADAFFKFMDYLNKKALLKPATARARKAAGSKMLAVLEDEEKQDLREIDIDDLHERFTNKSGTGYTPTSLQVYKSRFKSALQDFIRFTDNPSGFKPALSQRDMSKGAASGTKRKKKRRQLKTAHPATVVAPPLTGTIVFPVPLRPDLTVEIHNVPSDMTEQEADKIAAVVKALAQK